MGAPVPEMNPADDATAEALLSSLRTIAAAERRKHASVFNYWLSIRGDRQFPPIRDLDPLEISDAGPFSVLLEMIGAEDADIRHIGQAIKGDVEVGKLSEAPHPSVLSSIAKRVPVVAACRQAFAFEDEFKGPDGKIRCWITLLPFSATGTWIDYVYGFVSLDPAPDWAEEEEAVEAADEPAQPAPQPADKVSELLEVATELVNAAAERSEEEPPAVEEYPEPETGEETVEPFEQKSTTQPRSAPKSGKPGFSAKFFESLAAVGGFYGKSVEVEPDLPEIPVTPEEFAEQLPEEAVNEPEAELAPEVESAADPEAELATELESAAEPEPEPEPEPEFEPGPAPEVEAAIETEPEFEAEPTFEPASEAHLTPEGTLQSKLTEVRAKADEARQAKLRANVALYEGLSAAYDFALEAEDKPEEYLKLVEEQGLKIQLRSPMKPVVRLAFNGMCDDAMIAQLEAVLSWALKQDLPRGSLAERIESEGGIGPILNGRAQAA